MPLDTNYDLLRKTAEQPVTEQVDNSHRWRPEKSVQLHDGFQDRISPEEADIQYQRMIDEATSFDESLSNDVWGAMYFTIIKDFPDLLHGDVEMENKLRFIFIAVCYCLNIFLQVALLFWIFNMVTLPAVRSAQRMYKAYHGGAFTEDGQFDPVLFNEIDFPSRKAMCQIVISKQFFLCSILFLWVAQCFAELRTVVRRVRILGRLPELPEGFKAREMVAEVRGPYEEERLLFLCVNSTTRFWLYALIFIPKSFIAVILCLSGSIWLTASLSFGDLILNSLALGFVVQVDELIFAVFLPPRLEANLQNTKIAFPEDNSKSEEAEMKAAYKRSGIFFTSVSIFVVVWIFFQPVLPGYRWDVTMACNAFNEEHFTPWCMPWQSECFPRGS